MGKVNKSAFDSYLVIEGSLSKGNGPVYLAEQVFGKMENRGAELGSHRRVGRSGHYPRGIGVNSWRKVK